MRPYLKTSECADILDVSIYSIRGEIKDGLLKAEVVDRPARPGRKTGYRSIRVYQAAWRAYLQRYWPQHPACKESA
jgi:hypothetical protein